MGTGLCKSQADKNQSPSMIFSDPHDMLESDRPVMWANTCSLLASFAAASQHRQSYSFCSPCCVVLQHFGGQKWLNLIWCHNTFAVKPAPLASEKVMSIQDLHQTHLYIGRSPQNFLLPVFSNAELIDVCCIAFTIQHISITYWL